MLAAYALTEAGSGSDSAAMRTTARRDGGYVLDGSKRFITNAGVAGLYTVFAKTDPDAGHAGISAFVVEADTPGFEVARLEEKMGIAGSTTGELVFDGCRVPEANRLGEEGEGFRLAMRILDRSRPGVAAQALGIAQGATDYALEYARTRETMGKPIAEHQLVAAKLADMETKTEAARGLLYRFGRMADAGVPEVELTKASAMAKLMLRRRRDGGHDRGRADPRRLRLRQGIPRRAVHAGREDHADLRGHAGGAASRDRARDAPRVACVPARRRRLSARAGLKFSYAGSGVEAALLAQYRFSAPWILTNHTMAPTIGSSIQSPVQPVNGAARPLAVYSFPTSEGTRNQVTGEITM